MGDIPQQQSLLTKITLCTYVCTLLNAPFPIGVDGAPFSAGSAGAGACASPCPSVGPTERRLSLSDCEGADHGNEGTRRPL